MNKCRACGTDNSYTADLCKNCGAKLDHAELESSGSLKEPEPPPSGRAFAAAAGASRGGSGGTGAEPARVSPPEPAPRFPAPAGYLDPNEIDVISDYGRGSRIISVIGSGNSGKSFFVNRLRREMLYSAQGAFVPKPPPAPTIGVSPAQLELTEFRPRKEDRDGDRVRQRPYLIVDVPAEILKEALEERRTAEKIVDQKAFICSLGLASAYVFVIRVEDVLPHDGIADEVRKSVQENIERFHEFAEAIAGSKHRLANGESAEAFVKKGISLTETREAYKGLSWHCETPIVVAFSLSDRLMNKEAPDHFDYDPYLFAWRERVRPLFKVVRDSFEYYRFEFLTCFEGHDSSTYEADYSLKHYGAVSTFD